MRNPVLNSTVGGLAGFASTQWGRLLVDSAAQTGDDVGQAAARAAWEHLYRIYCDPVYAFIRRRGRPRPEAQDLTQAFFVHLLETDSLRRADPAKGRFRSFLLGALSHFLVDDARRTGARKRGGGCHFVFLDDAAAAEGDYLLAAPAWETPERLFEARWAAAVVGVAFTRLREEMAAAGKGALYDALSDYIAGEEDAPYQEKADALGLTLPALKSVIHRLRKRYAVRLREEVARTVAEPGDVEAEMRYLRDALRTR